MMTSVKTTLRPTKKNVDAVNFAKGPPGAVADMGVRGRDTGFPVKNQRARKRGGFPFSFLRSLRNPKDDFTIWSVRPLSWFGRGGMPIARGL